MVLVASWVQPELSPLVQPANWKKELSWSAGPPPPAGRGPGESLPPRFLRNLMVAVKHMMDNIRLSSRTLLNLGRTSSCRRGETGTGWLGPKAPPR